MIRATLRLVRLPNTLSAAGQIIAGTALAAHAGGRMPTVASLVAGTTGAMCLYGFGVALNDWYDREKDAALAPGRPIPSGKITPSTALLLALILMVGGLGLFAVADPFMLLAGVPLVLAITAYDGPFKSRPLAAAFSMGLCRAFCAAAGLILGGLFDLFHDGASLPELLRYPMSYLILITLVTAVSQKEEPGPGSLGLRPLAIATGAAFMLPTLAWPRPEIAGAGLLLAILVSSPGLRPGARADMVVKQAIFSLPLFDALWALPADRRMALVCALIFVLGFPLRALIGQKKS